MPGRRWLYRALALGWTGTPKQHRLLERAIAVMAVIVIPIAISVHTVVSWVFAMTVQPMWHSTIFGPYFVVGAIFSGIAAIIIAMAVIRKAYHLEAYLKPIHFNNLGLLLLVFTLLWFYFTFAEFLTTYYGAEPTHMAVFLSKTEGKFSPYFWIDGRHLLRRPVHAARERPDAQDGLGLRGRVDVGRGRDVARALPDRRARASRTPGCRSPPLPTSAVAGWSGRSSPHSSPCFILLYAVFTKLFPIVSIWEIREGREHVGRARSRRGSRATCPDALEATHG